MPACATLSMERSYSLVSSHSDIVDYIRTVGSVNGPCTWFSPEVREGIHERHVQSTSWESGDSKDDEGI